MRSANLTPPRKNLTFILILTVVVAFGFLFTAPSVQSQRELNLTVSPPISYLKVAPGTTQTHTISIKNTGETVTTVTPQIFDFAIDNETGKPFLKDQHSFPYFTMPDAALKPISIEPNQVAQLQLRIEPPTSAPDQEYPISVAFSSSSAGNDNNGLTSVGGAVVSNVVVLVSEKNQLDKKLSIVDFGAPRVVDSFRGLTINPTLKNERFSTSTASGSATLTSWTGQTVAEYEIYPDNILGFNSRPIRAQANSENNQSPPQVTEFAFNPTFMFGPYQLTIQLDNDGTIDSFTHTIVAFPFSIVVAIAIGAVVAIVYWYKISQENTFKL